ncbi:MAG: hypothetical protein JJE52_01450 [Acidimicrobiia bacterium]|nr:hypothetical protein [Acidimicrobiia bacterium]
MAKTSDHHRPWAATRNGLAHQLGQIDGFLPGSVVVRHMPCGKPGCACKAEPPQLHGPYIQWTRTVEGKTVTRYLSPEQLERYKPWFDNARRLKELVAKLQIASVHALESEDRQAHTATPAPASQRSTARRGATKP